MLQAIERQAAAGIAEAKALILVVDGQTGVTSSDQEVVSWLRKTHPKKPVRPLATRAHPSALVCSLQLRSPGSTAHVCTQGSD